MAKYLFSYFTGNAPEEERVCFAVSEDGFHFRPLHQNQPVIRQMTGTKCCRDPFIIRDIHGGFYLIATDMQSSLGWCSNHGVVSWHSDDLLHWTDECAVDFHRYPATASCDKVWAPEALYDPEEKAYFVYYSVYNVGASLPLCIWYSYTTDFQSYTEPQPLFSPDNGLDAIDADIVEKDGKFYMYYKDEYHKTICYAVADRLTGPYRQPANPVVALTDGNAEGCCAYPLDDGSYLLMMDMYSDGGYFMQRTTDMLHFERVTDYSMDFRPRHGAVLCITDEEYERLVKYYEG